MIDDKFKKFGVRMHECMHGVKLYKGNYSKYWTVKTREKLVDLGYLAVTGAKVKLTVLGEEYIREYPE